MNFLESDRQYIMNTYKRFPIVIEKAEGNYLFDEKNQRYLDLFSGVGVSILGHRHPALMKTLQEQAELFLHISNHFVNKPAVKLAKILTDATFEGKVFFGNSGTEAAETCLKIIHKARDIRKGVVVLKDSYHGRTLGALRATRQSYVYQDFPAADFPVYEVERDNIRQLRHIFETHNPCAVLFEPVLGSGGVFPLAPLFVQEMEQLCKEYNALLCVDEVQTGFGRTGSLFAYQTYHISPDILIFGKAIGGGLPLGGTLAKTAIADVFSCGDHGSTFGPSPISAALGNTVMDVLQSTTILEDSFDTSHVFENSLYTIQKKYPGLIEDVRVIGMMIGITCHLSIDDMRAVQTNLLTKGFLIDVTQGNIIRLLPPLTLITSEANSFLAALENELTTIHTKKGSLT